jgi:pimeloyl-ACP methyl ester carboxylesterase
VLSEEPEAAQHPMMVPGGGDTPIAVYEYGNPGGAEILMVHGFSQSHLAWVKQYESPDLQDFRMVVVDLRGHGASGKPLAAENYNNSEMWAEDINAVIAAKNMKSPTIVGWSYGGLVITDYLYKYGQETLGGIVFVGAATQLGSDVGDTHLGPAATYLAEMMDPRQEVNIPATVAFLEACTYADLARESFQEALAYNMAVSPQTREAMLGRVVEGDQALESISIPVLIVQGENDVVVLPVAAGHIADKVSHAEQSYYAKIGHSPFLEQAPRFNSELAKFVLGVNQ